MSECTMQPKMDFDTEKNHDNYFIKIINNFFCVAHLRQRVKENEERFRNRDVTSHFNLRYMPDLLAFGGRNATGNARFFKLKLAFGKIE